MMSVIKYSSQWAHCVVVCDIKVQCKKFRKWFYCICAGVCDTFSIFFNAFGILLIVCFEFLGSMAFAVGDGFISAKV